MQILYKNEINDIINYCETKQLFKSELWDNFTEVFRSKCDEADDGWRCEYFGKTMRAACSLYSVSPSDELYCTLKSAVNNFLSVQDETGSFTSYNTEFRGWDMWGKKYVISSLLSFYEICKEEEFRETLLKAICRHADYITENIGDGNGKLGILDTSEIWGGLNSASIAETFLHLFAVTGIHKYLDFAKYVMATGGCRDGDLVQLAKENKLRPSEYPVVKAYEMISFFESFLDYYVLTGDQEYLTVFENFIEKVRDNEITVIGCAGCTDELFDNAGMRQTENANTFMQETCVAVTWNRVLDKYYQATKKNWCIDEIEKTFVNDLLGAVNRRENRGFSYFEKKYVDVYPFDSYSPLCNSRRGMAIGGFKSLPKGGHYGCCLAIATSGFATYIKNIIYKEGKTVTVNYIHSLDYIDNDSELHINGSYLTDDEATICVEKSTDLIIRVKDSYRVYANNESVEINGNYVRFNSFLGEIRIVFNKSVEAFELNGKLCLKYDAMVLAQDESIAPIVSIGKEIKHVEKIEDNDAFVHLMVDGVHFIDYAHAGQTWNEKLITVWNEIG